MITKVAYTTQESSPGVPVWGTGTVTTTLIDGQTDIAIENLIAGVKYYVKTWNEDDFGNKSPEVTRVVYTPKPTKVYPLSISANGYLDSGSPMRAYVNIPTGTTVSKAVVNLAFRDFMAPATAAASIGTQTSVSSGTLTSASGGGATTGAPSEDHVHTWGTWQSNTPGTTGFVSRKFQTNGGVLTNFNLTTDQQTTLWTSGMSTGLTHTHATPNHTHTVPGHTHDMAGHSHSLTYGTFEEAYPASHSVKVMTYLWNGAGWTLLSTSASLTADVTSVDLTSVITAPGNYRLEVLSDAGQPNGGRIGLDVFGTILLTE